MSKSIIGLQFALLALLSTDLSASEQPFAARCKLKALEKISLRQLPGLDLTEIDMPTSAQDFQCSKLLGMYFSTPHSQDRDSSVKLTAFGVDTQNIDIGRKTWVIRTGNCQSKGVSSLGHFAATVENSDASGYFGAFTASGGPFLCGAKYLRGVQYFRLRPWELARGDSVDVVQWLEPNHSLSAQSVRTNYPDGGSARAGWHAG